MTGAACTLSLARPMLHEGHPCRRLPPCHVSSAPETRDSDEAAATRPENSSYSYLGRGGVQKVQFDAKQLWAQYARSWLESTEPSRQKFPSPPEQCILKCSLQHSSRGNRQQA